MDGQHTARLRDLAAGALLGVFFGLAVVVRHQLGDQWAGLAQWLPIVPTLAVVAWEHRLSQRGPRAQRVVWAGLAVTIISILAGAALLRAADPAGPSVEALAVLVVALPMVVSGAALSGD